MIRIFWAVSCLALLGCIFPLYSILLEITVSRQDDVLMAPTVDLLEGYPCHISFTDEVDGNGFTLDVIVAASANKEKLLHAEFTKITDGTTNILMSPELYVTPGHPSEISIGDYSLVVAPN